MSRLTGARRRSRAPSTPVLALQTDEVLAEPARRLRIERAAIASG